MSIRSFNLGPAAALVLSSRGKVRLAAVLVLLFVLAGPVRADAPVTTYIFPAGGQRGTSVKFRVGGLYLHESCPFEMAGSGITASPMIERTKTIWFEGPVIPLTDSQQAEDYPQDMAGTATIASDASLGPRGWRVWTAQGAVPSRPFVVGALPEVVEDEIDGDPIAVKVGLPQTINGRIFPREDVDVWSFEARGGQQIVCSAVTARLGSPFDAHLEIRDARGRRLAESSEAPPPGCDALAAFTAPADGTYSVRIHDVKFGGLQHYVYRLTIAAGPFVEHVYPLGGRRGTSVRFALAGSNVPADPVELFLPADAPARHVAGLGPAESGGNLFAVETGDLPEALEHEPNDDFAQVQAVEVPAVCNGRIDKPGDADYWAFQGIKEQTLEFDLRAARLGSPLDSVIVLCDRTGKELARADDSGGNQSDSFLRFKIPETGLYFVRVEERLASRGGTAFAYRLHVALPPAPDFRLHLPGDALSVNRAGEAKLKVRVERLGGLAEPVTLQVDNLPQGVSVANNVVPANAAEVELTFKADAAAAVTARGVSVRGTAPAGGKPIERLATFVSPYAPELESSTLLLAVGVPTPFKVKGVYEVKYAQRGGKLVRHFSIDRGGFDGPLRVRLADRQARHLQGVTGPSIEVPAGVSEFDYPVYLPPWMEIGRTSRSVVMAVGEVADPDGSRHKVSFTSLNQNEQIVALVDPGQLSVELDRSSLAAAAGQSVALPLRVGRGQGVNVPVRVELVVPGHIRGVTAEPCTLPADAGSGALTIRFAAGDTGPFNMPLVIRATAMKGDNDPVVAEAKLDVVARQP